MTTVNEQEEVHHLAARLTEIKPKLAVDWG